MTKFGNCQSVILGVNRALASRRMVTVRGRDLYGVEQTCKVAVANIGPLLVLKLNAFGGPNRRPRCNAFWLPRTFHGTRSTWLVTSPFNTEQRRRQPARPQTRGIP